jgi:predicted dienelactone hydrolase
MSYRTLPLGLLLSLAACDNNADTGADTPVDYAARGDRPVGYTVLEHDTAGGPLEVKAWYPTHSDEDEATTYQVQVKLPGFGPEPLPFLGAAIADAAPAADAGRYPLVVLSHGFGMNPEWYHPLAEHLASHGFVVLAPEHLESDWATDVLAATVDRPLEVAATIDLAEEGALDGIIDTDRVAVIGHSYGGYTALAAGGARIHTSWLAAACADTDDSFVQAMFCGPFLAGEADLATDMGLDAVPVGLWPALSDDRVDAVVAMAPNAYLFGDVGLAELDVPALIMGGTGDTAAPWGWGAGLAYDHVSSDTLGMVAFEGAEHFINVTTCEHMPWTTGLPEPYVSMFCEDPAWDKDEALTVANETTAAFLLYTLTDSAQAGEALRPDRFADVPGLQVSMEHR